MQAHAWADVYSHAFADQDAHACADVYSHALADQDAHACADVYSHALADRHALACADVYSTPSPTDMPTPAPTSVYARACMRHIMHAVGSRARMHRHAR